ncbi:MAG: hypothetical protein RB191_12510 [Terriglobia bacterium]|nr:hypothetical protein [Terriglobia bacterium]
MSEIQCGWTKPSSNYPGYLNVTRDGDNVSVTVRADASADGKCGETISLTVTFEQWQKFFRDIADRIGG